MFKMFRNAYLSLGEVLPNKLMTYMKKILFIISNRRALVTQFLLSAWKSGSPKQSEQNSKETIAENTKLHRGQIVERLAPLSSNHINLEETLSLE